MVQENLQISKSVEYTVYIHSSISSVYSCQYRDIFVYTCSSIVFFVSVLGYEYEKKISHSR